MGRSTALPMATLPAAAARMLSAALVPMAILFEPVKVSAVTVFPKLLKPIAIFCSPLLIILPANCPIPTLLKPIVLEANELVPIAVLC